MYDGSQLYYAFGLLFAMILWCVVLPELRLWWRRRQLEKMMKRLEKTAKRALQPFHHIG